MNRIALKMLVGDRAKYIGIVIGLTFASLLITQQSAIFVGVMMRTCGFITDTSYPDIWVMDEKVLFVDDTKPLQDTQLFRVRGLEGIGWAVPLYKSILKARMANGTFQTCIVVGLDDATLIGGPPNMIEGQIADLRRSDSVIVDIVGATTKLAKPPRFPGDKPVPLKIGDTVELNDHRAIVVGLCRVTRTFQSQPMIYTTYSRATSFAPRERRLLTFILVKAKQGQDVHALCERIRRTTGLAAYTRQEFADKTRIYFLKYTGIPINFGIAVTLGFVVGTVIAGMTFYNFTLDNLRYFGVLKAMGASNGRLLMMIMLQAMLVGFIGYGLGVGGASLLGHLLRNTELAFRLPWELLAISACTIVFICLLSAVISMYKVVRLEPAIVFKS